MPIQYIAKSARRVHAEHTEDTGTFMLFQFTRPFLFIYSFIIINYYFLVEKKLQNTEKDSKPSLYKTLMGDIISYLKKNQNNISYVQWV